MSDNTCTFGSHSMTTEIKHPATVTMTPTPMPHSPALDPLPPPPTPSIRLPYFVWVMAADSRSVLIVHVGHDDYNLIDGVIGLHVTFPA